MVSSRAISSVYTITGPDGIYVGFTTRSAEERFFDHVRCARGKTDRHPLYQSMRRHGIDAFAMAVVAQSRSEHEARDVEQIVMLQMRADGERVLNGVAGQRSRLSLEQRAELWVRKLLGEDPAALAREYGISAKTLGSEYAVGRIVGKYNSAARAKSLGRDELMRRVRSALRRNDYNFEPWTVTA